jgi:hypothetical protein
VVVKALWLIGVLLLAACPKQSITIVPSVERKAGVPDLGDMSYALDADDEG